MPQPLPESARERLAARARRMAVIRRRVLVATLATFALAWGVIAFDGSMGSTTTASTQAATTTSSASNGATSSSSNDNSSSSSDNSSSSSSNGSSAAVTTSQS
jgi:cytoskeletal protein RodZ